MAGIYNHVSGVGRYRLSRPELAVGTPLGQGILGDAGLREAPLFKVVERRFGAPPLKPHKKD